MNYIILDMEWNQAMNAAQTVRSPVILNGEIIQIGAVKVNEKFEYLDKIKINVRPKYYKKMNPHVEKITGITDVQLKSGETFPQAFRRLSEWCGGEFRFITWGFDDIGILADNLALYGFDSRFGADYINVQLIYNRQMKSEHLQCALSTAAEALGIPLDVQVHDAFNDALLTFEVCKKLDMTLGIAEYAEYAPAIPVAVFKDAVNGVYDSRKMLSDSRVTEFKCPACGEKLTLGQWLFSGKACKTIAGCKRCGVYSAKLKAVKVGDEDFTVLRTLYAADGDDVIAFEEKLRKRAERMERRRQIAEGKKNDNNGTV